ncbi:hypothetical protein [Myceligenerans crystallogenes]|uniref:Uncharacterized protein n=1 Tax=Myceligenerans crystallogenes TaxID=316335 RepID=A0ABP4ZYI4_9MICO
MEHDDWNRRMREIGAHVMPTTPADPRAMADTAIRRARTRRALVGGGGGLAALALVAGTVFVANGFVPATASLPGGGGAAANVTSRGAHGAGPDGGLASGDPGVGPDGSPASGDSGVGSDEGPASSDPGVGPDGNLASSDPGVGPDGSPASGDPGAGPDGAPSEGDTVGWVPSDAWTEDTLKGLTYALPLVMAAPDDEPGVTSRQWHDPATPDEPPFVRVARITPEAGYYGTDAPGLTQDPGPGAEEFDLDGADLAAVEHATEEVCGAAGFTTTACEVHRIQIHPSGSQNRFTITMNLPEGDNKALIQGILDSLRLD